MPRSSAWKRFFSGQDLLFTLLMKVGVAASLAALLVRWEVFRKVLFTEVRDSDLKLKLMLFLTPALALGVMLATDRLPLPLRRSDAGGFLPAGLARRTRGRPARRLHGEPSGVPAPRVALDAHGSVAGLVGGLIRQVIPNKEGHLEFWAVHFSERSSLALAICAARSAHVGNAAAGGLCWARTWPAGAGPRHQAAMALLHRRPELVVRRSARAGDHDGRRRSHQDLEQHAHPDESRAASAIAAQGAHGRAFQPDQPSFSVQHAQYGLFVDSLRSRSGAGRGAQAEQYPSPPAAQARDVCAAARRARLRRRLPGHRGGAIRPRQSADLQACGPEHARSVCAQHAPAAHRGKLHQARLWRPSSMAAKSPSALLR